MSYNVEISVSNNRVQINSFDVRTGEFAQKNGYLYIAESEPWDSVDKIFAVFKYDKKEYESEIVEEINKNGIRQGEFDIPIFEKPGYINVGVYGYRKELDEEGEETGRLELIMSPEMSIAEIKKGSIPTKPLPSANTYERLNQRITILEKGREVEVEEIDENNMVILEDLV